jgi:hypothetical protein
MSDTVDKYYAEDIRARNGCNLDAQYVPFHQHEARVDQLKAENAKLRDDFKFQAVLTEALLPYQEGAVALREVLRDQTKALSLLFNRYNDRKGIPYILSEECRTALDRARALLEGK